MTIKELREKYNLSQAKLAASIGVSTSTISAIESGRMKVSQKIADAVKDTYGEVIETESKVEKKAEKVEKKAAEVKTKAKTTKKKAETKAEKVTENAEKVEKKAATAKTRAKTAQKKAEEVKAALKKVEKKARNVKTMAAEAKEKDALELAVDAVELEEKIEKKVKTTKKKITQKVEIFLQSPMGGEITPEMILAKVGQVDKVYVRLDQNKIYWVKGDETGAVDIW